MNKSILLAGSLTATIVAGGGALIYQFSGEGKSQPSPNNASYPSGNDNDRVLSDDVGATNNGKTLNGNNRRTNYYIGAADTSQSDQFPKLLDCSSCSQDDWKKLINVLRTFGSSSDNAREQYKLDQQLYDKDDPFANYSVDHVSHPNKQTANHQWLEWRTQWTNKIQGAPGEPWQCVLNLTLENLRKHFPNIIPEETPTTSVECSGL